MNSWSEIIKSEKAISMFIFIITRICHYKSLLYLHTAAVSVVIVTVEDSGLKNYHLVIRNSIKTGNKMNERDNMVHELDVLWKWTCRLLNHGYE